MNYWEKANHSWTSDSKRLIHTPSSKTKELFFYIQEIGYFKAMKPYYTEREHLPSYLIKFTLNGQGLLNYAGQEYLIQRGDVFFIDCQKYQHYQTISDEAWEMDWIHLYGATAEALYQEFMKDNQPVFHTTMAPEENPIHHLIQKMIREQEQANARSDFNHSVAIHELLNEVIIQKYELDFTLEDIPKHVIQMKEYIDQQVHHSLSLDELEQKFLLNKYQLLKDFSKYVGIPPIDYLITQKISYAKDLLRYTDLSIQQISLEIGIDNFAYFSRLFKNKTGMTATFYRKYG